MRFFLTSLTIITVWLGSTLALPIQSLSGSSHVALERRTNEPPKPKLTEEEFTVKTQEAAKGMQAAFRRFPDMEARLLDILGLNVSELTCSYLQEQTTNGKYNGIDRQLEF